MTPKEYLNQVNAIEAKIKVKQDQILIERTRAESCTQQLGDRVQTSNRGDSLANAITKIWEFEQEMDALIDDLIDLKREILSTFDKMTNAEHIMILDKKYLKNETLVQIAVEMNYSYAQVKRKHGWALEEFRKCM